MHQVTICFSFRFNSFPALFSQLQTTPAGGSFYDERDGSTSAWATPPLPVSPDTFGRDLHRQEPCHPATFWVSRSLSLKQGSGGGAREKEGGERKLKHSCWRGMVVIDKCEIYTNYCPDEENNHKLETDLFTLSVLMKT